MHAMRQLTSSQRAALAAVRGKASENHSKMQRILDDLEELFEAVGSALATQAERLGETCSWDQEAVQEHDKLTGDFSVKLRFWSSRPHSLHS